jgi:hypothetical protein
MNGGHGAALSALRGRHALPAPLPTLQDLNNRPGMSTHGFNTNEKVR